jgi:hypothetical protein
VCGKYLKNQIAELIRAWRRHENVGAIEEQITTIHNRLKQTQEELLVSQSLFEAARKSFELTNNSPDVGAE